MKLARRSMLTDALLFHLGLAVLIGVVTGATVLLSMRSIYRQQLEQRGRTIVQFVAPQAQFPLLIDDWPELRRLAEKTARIEEVLFVEIVDRDCNGVRLAARGFAETDIPPCTQRSGAQANFVRRVRTASHSSTLIEASYSVEAPGPDLRYGMNDNGAPGESLGTVRIGLSVDRATSNAIAGIRRATLLWSACLVLILVLVFLQLRRVLAPVHDLATFAAAIDEASLDRRAKVSGAAELAALADAFNRMLDRLAATLVSRDLAEQASKAKGQFLANMGHELRTPLNAIIGYSEMLAEECQERGAEWLLPDLRKIRSSARMLLDLMNDLLDYSKAESGRMQLTMQAVDVGAALQEVADTVEPMARHNGNRLVLEAPSQPMEICADPLRFRQSLLNLASNACKFTENGTVTLQARRARRNGRDWCEVSVRDTGIGIPREKIAQLFEAFIQLEPSNIRKYGGTGLGLAISRKFCRLMGGDITVESTSGKGSTFTISLPVDSPPVGPAPQASADSAETIRGA
ncbi:MAG TPA: HAMP domain-containing sensor histidine kinase [Bryobacteraceae bacterium]|nr:HAMP domain-containing sensor histidine kinase [Bryobacteraceae bacterium]